MDPLLDDFAKIESALTNIGERNTRNSRLKGRTYNPSHITVESKISDELELKIWRAKIHKCVDNTSYLSIRRAGTYVPTDYCRYCKKNISFMEQCYCCCRDCCNCSQGFNFKPICSSNHAECKPKYKPVYNAVLIFPSECLPNVRILRYERLKINYKLLRLAAHILLLANTFPRNESIFAIHRLPKDILYKIIMMARYKKSYNKSIKRTNP